MQYSREEIVVQLEKKTPTLSTVDVMLLFPFSVLSEFLFCFFVSDLKVSVHALCQALLTVNLLTPVGKKSDLLQENNPLIIMLL